MLELICFIRVCDAQSVQITRAPNLELGHVPSLFNLDRPSVFATSCKEELLDFFDSLRLQKGTYNKPSVTCRQNTMRVVCASSRNQQEFHVPRASLWALAESSTGYLIQVIGMRTNNSFSPSLPGHRPHQPNERTSRRRPVFQPNNANIDMQFVTK